MTENAFGVEVQRGRSIVRSSSYNLGQYHDKDIVIEEKVVEVDGRSSTIAAINCSSTQQLLHAHCRGSLSWFVATSAKEVDAVAG